MDTDLAADKKLKDLEKKLKSYEGKLATLNAINSALQNENDDLRAKLTSAATPSNATDVEVEELKEEFARRLGTADRQIQQLQDEREELRAQVRLAAHDGTASSSKLQERDDHIAALQQEGEKLSRKNGELESIARKVRAQLREAEGEKEKLATLLSKTEQRAGKLADKLKEVQKEGAESLAAARSEVQRAKQEAEEAVAAARQTASASMQQSQQQSAKESAAALAAAEEREAVLLENLAELRSNLENMASEYANKEAELRSEAFNLEARVRELESVNHALQGNTSDATGPLLRQIESMAAAASIQQQAAAEAEHRLQQRISEAHQELKEAFDRERAAAARATAAEHALPAAREMANANAVSASEARALLEAEKARNEALRVEIEALQQQLAVAGEKAEKLAATRASEIQTLKEQVYESEEQLRASSAQYIELQERLAVLEASLESSSSSGLRKSSLSTKQKQQQQQVEPPASAAGPNGSTTSKLVQVENIYVTTNAAVGVLDIVSPYDDGLDMDALVRSVSGHQGAGNAGGPSTQTLEEYSAKFSSYGTLSTMSHDQGRIKLLEQRLQLAESARDAANNQLVATLETADAAQRQAAESAHLQKQLQEVQMKCDSALEYLGERNERIEQLEEDIREMKHIFHSQLNEAVNQLEAVRAQLENQRAGQQTPATAG